MRQARSIPADQPSPIFTTQQPRGNFDFPAYRHLLITTPSQVYTWDSTGVRGIFRSSKCGIAAAREAPDGSGLLAVADKHVVVLHDTKHGQDKSWGLGAQSDEVRQLEYTADAKSLYLSMSATADIQRYSMELSRLLEPSRAHVSPPVALAISQTGRFMVSASEDPTVIFVRSLEPAANPVLLEPTASRAAVTIAAFHSERPSIFLLAFRDGTVAVYDATRIVQSGRGSLSNQHSINRGEIGHMSALHHSASSWSKISAISGAAFLPGFKWRIVTTGNDGRCRIIDFANGGVTLRTWHAKLAATSVSVIALKPNVPVHKATSVPIAAHVLGGPTSTDSLIAVGGAGGQVLLYDSVGLLLDQRRISESGERVISVQWIKAPSPIMCGQDENIKGAGEVPRVDAITSTQVTLTSQDDTLRHEMDVSAGPRTTSASIDPSLNTGNKDAGQPATQLPSRKLTIHPDENEGEEGTVRRVALRETREPMDRITDHFKDLFSTAKTTAGQSRPCSLPRRIASPPRSRPTVTSQTFVKSPEPGDPSHFNTMARRRNLALFPSTDSKPEALAPPRDGRAKTRRTKRKDSRPLNMSKAMTGKIHSTIPARSRPSFESAPARLHENNGRDSKGTGAGDIVAGIVTTRPKSQTAASSRRPRWSFLQRSADHIEIDGDSETARETYENVHKRRHWPKDSIQNSSAETIGFLNAELRLKSCSDRNVLLSSVGRPSGRQTSRARVRTGGTMGSAGRRSAKRGLVATLSGRDLDGSMEEDFRLTNRTHVTSSGTFSPSSKSVRELCPRSSSLSPHKRNRSKDKPKKHRESAPKSVMSVPSNSPWARAKVLRTMENGTDRQKTSTALQSTKNAVERFESNDGQTVDSVHASCVSCRAMHARVTTLEEEVLRLASGMRSVKSDLSRCGITVRSIDG